MQIQYINTIRILKHTKIKFTIKHKLMIKNVFLAIFHFLKLKHTVNKFTIKHKLMIKNIFLAIFHLF